MNSDVRVSKQLSTMCPDIDVFYHLGVRASEQLGTMCPDIDVFYRPSIWTTWYLLFNTKGGIDSTIVTQAVRTERVI
jgi:hypothetical protein